MLSWSIWHNFRNIQTSSNQCYFHANSFLNNYLATNIPSYKPRTSGFPIIKWHLLAADYMKINFDVSIQYNQYMT